MRLTKEGTVLLRCTRPTSCASPIAVLLYPPLTVPLLYRKLSDGMFLSACRQVSKDFPNIKYDEDNLDRVCLSVCYLSCTGVPPLMKCPDRSPQTQHLTQIA